MIRAVVFDLDDTLYPEVDFVFSGYRAVAAEATRRWGVSIYDALVARFTAGERGDLFTPVLTATLGAVGEDTVRELVRVYREHTPRIAPFPETLPVLETLQPRYRLALLSDGYLAVQEGKLAALGLRHLLSAVIFSDAFGREYWKPHPRPYQASAEQLGLPLSELVYVGDNPAKDFITGRALGMATVRVRRPGTLHGDVQLSAEYEADQCIPSLRELPAMLAALDA